MPDALGLVRSFAPSTRAAPVFEPRNQPVTEHGRQSRSGSHAYGIDSAEPTRPRWDVPTQEPPVHWCFDAT